MQPFARFWEECSRHQRAAIQQAPWWQRHPSYSIVPHTSPANGHQVIHSSFLTTRNFAKHSSVDMQQREFQAFAAAFQTVNRLIETFRSHLPPITKHEANDPAVRTLILIHGLTDAASIKLHGIFAYADSASKQHCLTAARNVIQCGGVNLTEVGYLNPIMGVSRHHKHVAMRC